MGKLKLPDTTQGKTPVKREPAVKNEPLAPGDIIDYRLTVEVDTGHGKAWVKFGGESAVREGETTDAARIRFTDWVNEEIDRRIEDLS